MSARDVGHVDARRTSARSALALARRGARRADLAATTHQSSARPPERGVEADREPSSASPPAGRLGARARQQVAGVVRRHAAVHARDRERRARPQQAHGRRESRSVTTRAAARAVPNSAQFVAADRDDGGVAPPSVARPCRERRRAARRGVAGESGGDGRAPGGRRDGPAAREPTPSSPSREHGPRPRPRAAAAAGPVGEVGELDDDVRVVARVAGALGAGSAAAQKATSSARAVRARDAERAAAGGAPAVAVRVGRAHDVQEDEEGVPEPPGAALPPPGSGGAALRDDATRASTRLPSSAARGRGAAAGARAPRLGQARVGLAARARAAAQRGPFS